MMIFNVIHGAISPLVYLLYTKILVILCAPINLGRTASTGCKRAKTPVGPFPRAAAFAIAKASLTLTLKWVQNLFGCDIAKANVQCARTIGKIRTPYSVNVFTIAIAQ